MMNPVVLLIIGLVLLFLGGELLVRGAVSIAVKLRISTLVVGMTIVSFATSSPELFVSLQALLKGNSNIALGNVIGSNIANLALVLALTTMIFRVQISKQILNINLPFLLISSLVLGMVLYFFNGITSMLGWLFILILAVFIFFLINRSRKECFEGDDFTEKTNQDSIYTSVSLLIFGVLLLKYGADSLIDSVIAIANHLQISDRVVAVTIVAVGTSIPELATSIVAAFKKENNLAVGNLIGSNIFNILAVLGISSIVREISIEDPDILYFDYMYMIATTIVLALFMYLTSKRELSRQAGALLFLSYVFYIYLSLS